VYLAVTLGGSNTLYLFGPARHFEDGTFEYKVTAGESGPHQLRLSVSLILIFADADTHTKWRVEAAENNGIIPPKQFLESGATLITSLNLARGYLDANRNFVCPPGTSP
jgi:hypothetical protein